MLIVVLLIGGVAGMRMLLREDDRPRDTGSSVAEEATATGKTVPLKLDPLPSSLRKDGDFSCNELKVKDGTFTARAEGGSIVNVSGGPLTYEFAFTVASGAKSEMVQSRFRLNDGQKIPSVTMASKSLPSSITACHLRIASAEASQADIQAVNEAARKAGCGTVQRVSEEGRAHIESPKKGVYSSSPPTSGDHYAAPAATGTHRDPIPNETQVHNLEHGHVGLQYRGVNAAVRQMLEGIAAAQPEWIFAAPYPSMNASIALTAWTVSVTCPQAPADVDALGDLARAFVAVFRNQGLESIPGRP